MNLTAKLALSQIKVNKSRTTWTLLGIILCVTLITAVCSFAASGLKIVADLFGVNSVSGGVFAIFLIPIVILIAIIISMSVVVISNALRVSAGERTAQFGILKSVGATKSQIISTVLFESVFLSAFGIPIGIIVGLITAFVGVQIANYFLGELNNLVHMMMNELTITVHFVVSWQALVAASLISFAAVLFSAWLPARKAAKISAIVGIRGADEVKIEGKKLRTNGLIEKVFGFEGTLSAKNMKRNGRNFRASVISLTVSVILFVTLSSLSEQARLLEKSMFPAIDSNVFVDYTSVRNKSINESTGREQVDIVAPISSERGNAIANKLREFNGAKILGVSDDNETYRALVPKDVITPQMMEAYFSSDEQLEYEVSSEILMLDNESYTDFCNRANIPVGSNILINHYAYNANGKTVSLVPFSLDGREVRLIKADNSMLTVPIHGTLTEDDIPNELIPPNRQIIRLIIPQGQARGYTWYAAIDDTSGFIDYANAVMSEEFPQADDYGYMELGYNTSVYTYTDYMKVMNIAIGLVSVFVYSFVALLTLIGLTNVISTISANVRTRSREFAVLTSVGMTYAGLKHMLNLESVMCTAKSLTIGLPVSIALTYLINLPIRAMFPIPYEFPLLSCAYCIVVVFAITWLTIRYSAARLKGGNIIEIIRGE